MPLPQDIVKHSIDPGAAARERAATVRSAIPDAAQSAHESSSSARHLAASVVRAFAAPRRLWLLIAALGAAALLLFVVALRPIGNLGAPYTFPWWAIAIGYALAEVLVVHLQFRRDTHSFSLSEVPFVVALFFLTPADLLLALLVGTAPALLIHRRQPPVKLLFNLANLALAACVGLLVFRAVVVLGQPLGPTGWVGAATAAVTSDLFSIVMITVAVRIATGRRSELRRLLGSGGIAALLNTCLALVTVTLLWVAPDASWLPLVLAGLMVAAYRIYGSVRQKHESLEVLYGATRRLQGVADPSSVIETVLRQAQEMFHAERVELLLLPSAADPAVEVVLKGEEAGVASVELAALDPIEGVWARVAAEGAGFALPRPIPSARLREYFGQRGIHELAVAPLYSQERVIGTLLVANRRGALTYGADDARLLETFAHHASASLENAHLIGSLRRHAEESRHQALHDSLTGLPNRVLFRQRIDEAIRAGGGDGFAVALMDLDKFKEVNDTLGHHNGDLLLQAVAARLQSSVRPVDLVARLGGDEFGVLMAGSGDPARAELLARRLRDSLATPFDVQELTLEVEASVGIALYPAHGGDADTLIQRADVAMYEAKAEYVGHTTYDAERDSYSPKRLLLVGELRRALENHELAVAYQPQVDVRDGRIVGAEALIRWPHPTRGDVPPDDFVPIAEHTGLLKPMTMYVLAEALEACARWRADGREFTVAVNLSVRNLLDLELPADVSSLLGRYSLPPTALELEVTESALIADPARSNEVLHRLRDAGIGIAIDDYGTGYSSLAYIRRMPINELKIDRSFVMGMENDDNDRLIVRSTIDLAHNLGLRVVAEGVENAAAWQSLRDLGCDRAQGYYFGRPQSAADVGASLVDRGAIPEGTPRPVAARARPLKLLRTRVVG